MKFGQTNGNIPVQRLARAVLLVVSASGVASAQTTTRVNVSSAGVEANRAGDYFAISGDGRFVAFDSRATNLVAGDTNGVMDVFVHDRATGVTERVSVDSAGNESNGESTQPALSADGRYVAFVSIASNLVQGDTNASDDIFVHDRTTGTTERVSVDSSGVQSDDGSRVPMLSADGQIVAFYSLATNLVAGDTNGEFDVFVHDRGTLVTECVSVDSTGAGSNGTSYFSFHGMSADGNVVAFESFATNLVPGDTNGVRDIFVHDRGTGATTRVSVDSAGSESDGDSMSAALSDDGNFVVFRSAATNLVAGDANHVPDVFLHEIATGATELCSVSTPGASGDSLSDSPSVSADGRLVAFTSYAKNFDPGDTNQSPDVFVRDRVLATTTLMSRSSDGTQGDGPSGFSFLSSDGQVLLFGSKSDNLVAGDQNGFGDVFVRENCDTDATWANYGAGFPGALGVPSLTAGVDPQLGTTLTVDVGNSASGVTFGLLVVGYQATKLHSTLGGDLLVVPTVTSLIGLTSVGATLSEDLPLDGALCGLVVDLQVLEADAGAAKGVSFTPGLELVFGQ